jgi:hypothetical protein
MAETHGLESPDVLLAMTTTLKTSVQSVHIVLSAALLAACAANLALVCAWL